MCLPCFCTAHTHTQTHIEKGTSRKNGITWSVPIENCRHRFAQNTTVLHWNVEMQQQGGSMVLTEYEIRMENDVDDDKWKKKTEPNEKNTF